MSNASPDHNGATPKPFDKRMNLDSSVKRTRLHCLIGNSLGACAVNHAIRRNLRAWVRGRPTYGRRARRPISHNRLPTVFGEICRLCVPTVLRAVSVAVRWRFHKCATRIVLSWRRDVTRGRPDRGWSAKCPVSLKRLTRQAQDNSQSDSEAAEKSCSTDSGQSG